MHAVLHKDNLPDVYKDVKLGSGPPDRGLFDTEVFEVGAPVAIVAADSEHIADEAIRMIEVQYEILPASLDFLEAMKPTTPHQFDTKLDGLVLGVTPPLVRGDPDNTKGEVSVDAIASKSFEQHVALELTNSLSWWDNDKLVMYYTSQWAHGVRAGLSQALKIPQNKVRVVQPGYVGSGYGYRSSIDLPEIHSAILAKITGTPDPHHVHALRGLRHAHPPTAVPQRDAPVRQQGRHASSRASSRSSPTSARSAQLGGQRLVVHHAGSVQDPEPEARSHRRLHQLATSRARIAASAIPTARSPWK